MKIVVEVAAVSLALGALLSTSWSLQRCRKQKKSLWGCLAPSWAVPARCVTCRQTCTAVGDCRVGLAERTPGVANVSPDFLSREYAPPSEGGDPKREPPALIGVPRLKVPFRGAKFWRTWVPPPVKGGSQEDT